MSYVHTTTQATYGYDKPPDMDFEDTGKAWVVRDQNGMTLAITRDEDIAVLLADALSKPKA